MVSQDSNNGNFHICGIKIRHKRKKVIVFGGGQWLSEVTKGHTLKTSSGKYVNMRSIIAAIVGM